MLMNAAARSITRKKICMEFVVLSITVQGHISAWNSLSVACIVIALIGQYGIRVHDGGACRRRDLLQNPRGRARVVFRLSSLESFNHHNHSNSPRIIHLDAIE